ncbi:hypothetical protein FOCC_FOCC008474 [Frankliniella occidentalis]|nr:hypothetical protein FOCC_FOCC008474 [Frankliniella occidentalis]
MRVCRGIRRVYGAKTVKFLQSNAFQQCFPAMLSSNAFQQCFPMICRNADDLDRSLLRSIYFAILRRVALQHLRHCLHCCAIAKHRFQVFLESPRRPFSSMPCVRYKEEEEHEEGEDMNVSWVRHRDIHLLTVGRYTYTSDQRFEAVHSPHTEDWTLRIRYPQRKDSGLYECQISTTPPMGHSMYLTVVVWILLTYVIRPHHPHHSIRPSNSACSGVLGNPGEVSWVRHRDIHLLTVGRYTYTSDQRFEAVHSPHTEDWTLRIRYPQRKDSGLYECQISTTPPMGHSMYLTVVGEHPAAMHHGSGGALLPRVLICALAPYLTLVALR